MLLRIFLLIFSLQIFSVCADELQTVVDNLQKNWDQTYFTMEGKPRKKALRALIKTAETLRLQYKDSAELHIWEGIIRASYNDAAGGIGGLRQAREAKALFEKAISINDKALNGLSYTELGALYSRVPGWPISFGDNDKARELLLKGLAMNGDDLEAHYLLGKFYIDDDNWVAAQAILEQGLALPEISERPAFDAARRSEMQQLLQTAKQHLAR